MTLPPSFKYFISVWKSTQPNERTLTNLILKPIEERRTEKRAENIAFIANKHQCKKNFKKSNVRSGVCHYCHKPRHWIKECKNRKAVTPKKNTQEGKERHSSKPCLQNII